jgi:hypothetical protein
MSAINARCGATQQSIAEGDRCRIVFLTQAADYKPIELDVDGKPESVTGIANTTVYPNCFWKPESAFIRAVYDDYGMTKLVLETPLDRLQVLQLLLDFFRSTVRTRAGENRFHDHAFDFGGFVRANALGLAAAFEPLQWLSPVPMPKGDEFDGEMQKCWDYLCDMTRRHRVFDHGFNRFVRPVEMFIVHERAYQALAEAADGVKDWNGNSMELRAVLKRGIAEGRQAVQEFLDSPEGQDPEKASFPSYIFTERLRSRVQRLDIDNCFSNSGARRVFDLSTCKLYSGELTEEDFVEKAFLWMRDRSVICAMEMHEIKFTPMTYVGADFKNAVGQGYAKLVSRVSEEVTADRKRANG